MLGELNKKMKIRVYCGKWKRKIYGYISELYLRYVSDSTRRRLWTLHPSACRMRRLERAMRKKDCISVAFIITEMAVWKGESVFKAMLEHPRFSPFIWLLQDSQIKDAELSQSKQDAVRDYVRMRGYRCADNLSLDVLREQYHPDIIFLAKPYPGLIPYGMQDFRKELVCYIPYGFSNLRVPESHVFSGYANVIWRRFAENSHIKKAVSHLLLNGGFNVVCTGYSPADELWAETRAPQQEKRAWPELQPSCKRVIWAPHWSVFSQGMLVLSNFLSMAEPMLKLVNKYEGRIHFAFKPHPLLKQTLYITPGWGKEKTEAYFEQWQKMPNSQLVTGEYIDLFRQSDAMVHDSSSFINEYLYVNKPCMFLHRKDRPMSFDELTLSALTRGYYVGCSVEDVEHFLEDVVLDGRDIMSDSRRGYFREMLKPPYECSAAQNIILSILEK